MGRANEPVPSNRLGPNGHSWARFAGNCAQTNQRRHVVVTLCTSADQRAVGKVHMQERRQLFVLQAEQPLQPLAANYHRARPAGFFWGPWKNRDTASLSKAAGRRRKFVATRASTSPTVRSSAASSSSMLMANSSS